MSDKEVSKALKHELITEHADNFRQIEELKEELFERFNKVAACTDDLSLINETYAYSLVDEEIGILLQRNRGITTRLQALD